MSTKFYASGEGGGKGGGGRASSGSEAPNTLQTKNIARVLYLIGEGENGGLVNGLQSVYIKQTPVQASDGTYNFNGISVQENTGTPDQLSVPGFDSVQEEVQVGVELTVTEPVIRRVSDPDVDSIRIKITFPALYRVNTASGSIMPTTVAFQISVRTVATTGEAVWKLIHDVVINDKTNSAQSLSWRVYPPDGFTGDWEWRVLRVTPDAEVLSLQNKLSVSSVTYITDGHFSYPYSHVIGVTADSEQFGSTIPQPVFQIKGMANLQIPANYDPDTKVYEEGIWNGVFTRGWTDNPAWVFYAVLTNKLWGIGRYIAPAQLSMLKWDCYEIGKFCDEQVPDGKGGMEARFTCNGVIAQQSDALDLLGALSSIFRGMMYWAAGGILVSSDRPKNTNALLVTQANVLGGQFERPGTRARDRVTSVKVVWNDPEDFWKQTIEVSEDDEAIRRFGLRTAQLAAFMCSSRGQAQRVGRWVLASQVLEPVLFSGGRDLAQLRPGDVVKIADPEHAQVRAGGRVTGLIGDGLSGFYVDKYAFPFPSHISVRLTTGVVERREVADESFMGDEVSESSVRYKIMLTTPLTAPPQTGAVWVGESASAEPELARVLSVEEREGNVFQFECLTYLPTLFAEADQTGTFIPRTTSIIPTGKLPVPTDITMRESLVASGPTVSGVLDVGWQASDDARIERTEVQIKRPDDSFKPVASVTGFSVQISNISAGKYSIRLRFTDGFGRSGEWVTLTRQLYGLEIPPPAIQNVRLSRAGGLAILTWDPVTELDVKIGGKIFIRYSPKAGGVGQSFRAISPLPGAAVQAVIPSLPGTFYIFAQDSGGRPGDVVSISSTAATVTRFSSAGRVSANPTWSGIHSGTMKSGIQCRLSSDSNGDVLPAGLYIMTAGIDLGEQKRVRLESVIDVITVNTNDNLILRKGNMIDFRNMLGTIFDECDAYAEVRTTPDDPSGSYDVFALADVFAVTDVFASDGDAVWSDWEELLGSEYNVRGVQGRLHLISDDPSYRIDCNKFEILAKEIAA